MWITNPEFDPLKLLVVLFVITTIATPINGSSPRKLNDTNVTGPPDTSIKCLSCSPCNNPPCSQIPPPDTSINCPSCSPCNNNPCSRIPPPPPPPPPAQDCPPPPSSSYNCITCPPVLLYPVNPYFSGDSLSFAPGLPLLIGCGMVGLLAFW